LQGQKHRKTIGSGKKAIKSIFSVGVDTGSCGAKKRED
jgi:hypothetical protein